jgi:ribonuclease HII
MLKSHYYDNTIEVGIDEAGRGPLFGRVYIGAAILPVDKFNHSLMKDSKRLSDKKRREAYEYIKSHAIEYSVSWMSETEIDNLNIYKATHAGMHKVLDTLTIRPENILVDGNKFYTYIYKGDVIPHVCITGGDNKYSAIAAASIIAKCERDNYIVDLCNKYPELDVLYDLKRNKGYGTKKHMDGINRWGITKWHRTTFGVCKKYDKPIHIQSLE